MGIGAGAASLYVPRYISEVSPVAVRGALATLNQVHHQHMLVTCPPQQVQWAETGGDITLYATIVSKGCAPWH